MYKYKIIILNMDINPTNISNTSTVQADRLERAYTHGRLYKAVIIFLLIIIIAVSFFVYALLSKSPIIPSDISELLYDTVVCKNCTSQSSNLEGEDLKSENSDWAIYEYPKYGISLKIPSNTGFLKGYESEIYRYVWSVYSFKLDKQPDYAIFPDFEERITVSYSPTTLPEIGTEFDALETSYIWIDLYKNNERFNIEELENILSDYMNEKFKNEPELVNKFESEISTFSSYDSFTFEQPTLFDPYIGEVILTDSNIVVIDRSAIFTKGEDLNITNRVIDSIEID